MSSLNTRYCHGLQHKSGPYPSGYWIIPEGKAMSEDTRCGFCQQFFGFTGKIATDSHGSTRCDRISINCNSGEDPTLTSVTYQGFRVGMRLLADSKVPLFIDTSQRDKSAHGVGIFVMPTQTDYQILIELPTDDDSANTFSIEDARVGDEKIVINGGRRIYYDNRQATIKGFETGGTRSFQFVSPSDWEKANGGVATDVLETLNQSNIITLKLQRYKRTPKRISKCPSKYATFGLSDSRGGEFYAGTKGFGGFGNAQFCSFGGGSWDESAPSGGSTVSGGRTVDHVKTTTAVDDYVEVGEPVVITLQIISRQGEAEKKRDNLLARLRTEGYDHWTHMVRTKSAEIAKLQASLDEATEELQTIRDRNAAILAQFSADELAAMPLDPAETEIVKQQKAARVRARQEDLLLKF